MKKNFILLTIATALVSFSCQKENIETPADGTDGPKRTITAYADFTQTKVEFTNDETSLRWRTGDQFGIYSSAGDENVASSKYKAGTPFTVELKENTTEFTAYWPYNGTNSSDQGIKPTQTWYFKNFPGWYPLKAEGKINEDNTVNLIFKPVACGMRLRIFGGKEGETLQAVNFKSGETAIKVVESSSMPRNISLAKASKEDVDEPVYVVVKKENIPAGAEFKITTTEGVYTFTTKKEIEAADFDFLTINLNLAGKTPEIDYYEQGVEIDGVTYSKDTKDAVQINASGNITSVNQNGKVCFIAGGLTMNLSGGYSNLTLIGRSSTERPTIQLSDKISINGAGSIIFKNVIIDATASGSAYMLNANMTQNFTVDNLIFEDCEIKLKNNGNLMYFNQNYELDIVNAVLRKNVITSEAGTGNSCNLFNFNHKNIAPEKVTIEDNLIYHKAEDACINGKLLMLKSDVMQKTGFELTIQNNTLVNFAGRTQSSVQNMAALAPGDGMKITYKNNLIVEQAPTATEVRIFAFMGTQANYKNVEITWSDNHFYPALPNSGNSWNWAYPKPASGNFTGEPSKITAETENPLTTCKPSTGTFVLGSAYAGWGSSLVPVE